MCTAISFLSKDHYFGRNLDLEYSYDETITITPRNFPLRFRHLSQIEHHYAFIGMSYIQKQYPLYYEATNEAGLSMAGLHFPKYAEYMPEKPNFNNVAPFEFIPWILGQCKTINEAKPLLTSLNLIKEDFSEELPLTPLHWMLADAKSCLIIECTKTGLNLYENPYNVMTNSPSFDIHLNNLKETSHIPGDWTSSSRFIRAVHVLKNSAHPVCECERISQFFHILSSVEQPKGVNIKGKDLYKYTIYSSCCNTSKGIYYYKTYNNFQITAIDMHKENLESKHLISYPLIKDCQIRIQNH